MSIRQHACFTVGLLYACLVKLDGTTLMTSNAVQELVHEVPGFLQLLQDMSSFNPARRPSAADALTRFRGLRPLISEERLSEVHEYPIFHYPLIPTSYWVMLRDMLECKQWRIAYEYTKLVLKSR